MVFTGPQASMFSFSDTGGYENTASGTASGSGQIIFAPTAGGAASATLTIKWQDQTGIHPPIAGPNTVYSLSGNGNSGGVPANEFPSMLQSARYLLIPTLGTIGKRLSYFDTTSLNDPVDASTYTFKSEDIIADRVPTLRRVVITHIDLGPATLVVQVTAVNDSGVLVINETTVTLGTSGFTGNMMTVYADVAVTGYRPQVTLIRAANAGSVSIVHVLGVGTTEKEVTL